MCSLRLQRLSWICYPGHARVRWNEWAGTADIATGLQLGWAEDKHKKFYEHIDCQTKISWQFLSKGKMNGEKIWSMYTFKGREQSNLCSTRPAAHGGKLVKLLACNTQSTIRSPPGDACCGPFPYRKVLLLSWYFSTTLTRFLFPIHFLHSFFAICCLFAAPVHSPALLI